MKHFLCYRRGLPDVTIGFFGGIGGCDGAAPSALAAAGSGLRMACSRFRRFSLRLGCSWLRLRCSRFWLHCLWLRLPPLAALGSLLLASTWLPGLRSSLLVVSARLLLASAWLFMASAFAACRAGFVTHGFDLAARGFGLRRLPPPLPAPRKPTGHADHTHTSFTSKH